MSKINFLTAKSGLKHTEKHHYIIQLLPALEEWILEVAAESGLNLEVLGLSSNLRDLQKITKDVAAENDARLVKLTKKLVVGGSPTVQVFAKWIEYLHTYNYNAQASILIQIAEKKY
jgi:hypothetical protein